ncbi:hydroquinone glucosyltransferase, partial [Quercus suber]
LDETVSCKHSDLQEPLKLQGCIPIHGRDLPESIQDRTSEFYKMFLFSENELRLAKGIILNTFMCLEESAIKALLEEDKNLTLSNWTHHSNWFNFKQSGSRFLWVLRSPNNKHDVAYLKDQTLDNNPLAFLPKGFVERTKGQSLVVPSWTPQAQVLSHGSTGGAALRPKANEEGLVDQEEIAKVVKGLMVEVEGKNVNSHMKNLKIAAEKALSADGSSTKILAEFISRWTNQRGF